MNLMIDWAKNKISFMKEMKFTKLYSVLTLLPEVKIFTMTAEETHEEIKNSAAQIL